jgi:hypothetical protein
MPNQTVPAVATGLPATNLHLGTRCGTVLSRNSLTDHYCIQPDDPRSASIHVRPEFLFPEDDAPATASAPAATATSITVTDGGRPYLLLMAILDGLDIEGTRASFEITPELADELAAFGSETEDLEEDDPAEESEPDEDGHDAESDVWFEEAP